MERKKNTFSLPRADGSVTHYDAETITRDNGSARIVIEDSPKNTGAKFCDSAFGRDKATEEQFNELGDQYKQDPSKVLIYRERTDGKYDRVEFRNIGWDPNQKRVHWGEETKSGFSYTKEQVEQQITSYLAADKGVQEKHAQQTNLSKASLPEIDRAEEQKRNKEQKQEL